MLCERSKTQRPHLVRFHLCEMFRIGKSMVTESKLVVARGWEEGNGSDRLLGPGIPFGSNGIILELDTVKHTTVYFRMVKMMNFAYANFTSTK